MDRPPLTKVAETMLTLVFGHPEVGFRYRHARDGSVFSYYRPGRGGGIVLPADVAALRDALAAGLRRIGAA
jgi:hypothetical protein